LADFAYRTTNVQDVCQAIFGDFWLWGLFCLFFKRLFFRQ